MNIALDNALRPDKTVIDEEVRLVKRYFGWLIKKQYDGEGGRKISWNFDDATFEIIQMARPWDRDIDGVRAQGPHYANHMREAYSTLYYREHDLHRICGPAHVVPTDGTFLPRFVMTPREGFGEYYYRGKGYTKSEFDFFVRGILTA